MALHSFDKVLHTTFSNLEIFVPIEAFCQMTFENIYTKVICTPWYSHTQYFISINHKLEYEFFILTLYPV